uniref:NADH-ubiquinone oxidoreductase chain 5 n=1 Tax=Heteropsylla cubana TaxID=121849 RepID=A0A344A2D8_9HEMI|nr:NADH dehydrogenase subunit 5 [Heteropsylla sp. DMP-2018]AWU48929.1 NADH dehydrogenase subunit 5 [Heteropsylla sp. DMP-2018]
MKINSKFFMISFFMICFSFFFMFIIPIFLWGKLHFFLELTLFNSNSIFYNFIIYVDWVSLFFMNTVLIISSLILIYSSEYMGKECQRFLWMTFFFIIFMLIMILSPSILGVVLGWDGLGLISFCLVIYYQSLSSYNSGFITAASNRVGDTMLIMSIVWSSMTGMFMFWDSVEGVLFFMFACFTKSAQFPFSTWLPAAMAAPTPISSLVHSSTLVTAGIYMMIRFYENLLLSKIMNFMLIISLITILIAGVSALQEYDLKRLVAYSTLGQLGFMLMILSVGHIYIAFFHLLIHALFKALLFMCTGFIIHASLGTQDMRKMGSLIMNPLILMSLNISLFSLMGVPFSSGFYSKDSLLELCMCSYGGVGLGVFMILMALVTISYCIRILYYLCSNSSWFMWVSPSFKMNYSILGLGLLNLICGGLLNWGFSEVYLICLDYYKFFPLIILVTGIIWHGQLNLNINLKWLLFSIIYVASLTKSMSISMKWSFCLLKLFDQGWAEGILLFNKNLIVKYSLFLKKSSENTLIFNILGVSIIMTVLI